MIAVLAAEPDPSWFYSSLAQSSAAVVGFVGAFLIFRIQDYMASWTRMASEIEALQRRWSLAESQVRSREWSQELSQEQARLIRVMTMGTLQDDKKFVDALERQQDDAWRDLRPLLDRRRTDEFPRELAISAALLGALFLAGTLAPLLFLSAPSNGLQVVWLVLVGATVAVIAGAMLYRAKQEFDRFKKVPLYGRVGGEYDHQLAQEEGLEEREHEERARLERARLERARLAEERVKRQEEEAGSARDERDDPAN